MKLVSITITNITFITWYITKILLHDSATNWIYCGWVICVWIFVYKGKKFSLCMLETIGSIWSKCQVLDTRFYQKESIIHTEPFRLRNCHSILPQEYSFLGFPFQYNFGRGLRFAGLNNKLNVREVESFLGWRSVKLTQLSHVTLLTFRDAASKITSQLHKT